METKYVGPWPAVIAGLIILVVLVGIAFISNIPSANKGLLFLIVLIGGIFWFGIIYWMCTTNNHVIGWFLLIVPLALYATWWLGKWFAALTVPEECLITYPTFS